MANPLESLAEACVTTEIFYEKLDALKDKQVKKDLPITLFIKDTFFNKAKAFLKYQTEKQLGIQVEDLEVKLSKWDTSTILRKKWAYSNG